jgi:NAD(P) transhydrogenase subunit beta
MGLSQIIIAISYIVASVLFIYGIKMLGSQSTARRGNLVSAVGMFIAVVVTLFNEGIVSYQYIILGIAIGAVIGGVAAMRVPMTSMPEFVALFNGFGGIASLLVGWAEYQRNLDVDWATAIPIYLAVLIGGITFTGSLIAYAKLAERMDSKPVLFSGQKIVSGLFLLGAVGLGVAFVMNPAAMFPIFVAGVVVAFILGVLLTIPIGGADMPVVIALLNSYSGLAACAAGFIIQNTVLIVSGSLVGASGLILTAIMCKAMNRSLLNVLFAGVGATKTAVEGVQGEAKVISVEDAYYVLEAATSVVFVPGYGMAVAQAQHAVRELAEILEENGCEVKHAIHPVAGRMPGHMNVLLAEANVPYEQLVEMDDINPIIETVDVAVVIGANDVVNPAARTEGSAIYGMPIINVDQARTCFVLKRSLKAGFAGVDNPLFFGDNTRMVLGDAKQTVTGLITEFKD